MIKQKIVYCFDKKYIFPFSISLSSLLKYNKNCDVYLLFYKKDQKEVENLIQKYFLIYKNSIQLISISDNIFENWKESFYVDKWKFTFFISKAAYLKFLIPNYIKSEKIIYLDSDTLVQNNISPLFDLSLDQNSIGGVIDIPGGDTSKIKRGSSDIYINTGVLLMDLQKIKKNNFLQDINNIYKNFEQDIVWADQCIFNKYFENDKKILDSKWNKIINTRIVTSNEFKDITQNNNILHFAGGIKPWQKWCNPVVFEYYQALVKEFRIVDFIPDEIKTVDQALELTSCLDLNKNYAESSKIKSGIIDSLLKNINVKESLPK